MAAAAPIETPEDFKRILVTGGAGFLGAHLCRRLVNQGHEVNEHCTVCAAPHLKQQHPF